MAYEDLFDIEKRPGAGVGLWARAVEMQLERVREANYSHRLHHSPNEQQKREDPDAERRLHADVYFLALAIRRVLLFHDVFAKQVDDERLRRLRAKFDANAPKAKELRDFYEHLDEYLLDRPAKHVKFAGRAAPVLLCRWDCDNVIVRFGEREIDVTARTRVACSTPAPCLTSRCVRSIRTTPEQSSSRDLAAGGLFTLRGPCRHLPQAPANLSTQSFLSSSCCAARAHCPTTMKW